MYPESQPLPLSKRKIVHQPPGVEAVSVRRDEPFGSSDDPLLTMDLYVPPGAEPGARYPAVLLVTGYPDPGYEAVVGCKFKETGWSTSWARLAAAFGIVAITYSNRDPARNVRALLRHLGTSAASLGIDEKRIGIWASSGSAPLALSLMMRHEETPLKCGALLYGYTMDLEGAGAVADAARKWKFVDVCAGASIEDFARVPLFLARAGRDEMPGLNEALDRFVRAALSQNLPLTCANDPEAPHAFDLVHDSEISRETIRRIVAFTRFHLVAQP